MTALTDCLNDIQNFMAANKLKLNQIDYCNSLFASLTLSELKRLQGVQNSLCRVVTRSSRYTHANSKSGKTTLVQNTVVINFIHFFPLIFLGIKWHLPQMSKTLEWCSTPT